jgi:hypothetical protein
MTGANKQTLQGVTGHTFSATYGLCMDTQHHIYLGDYSTSAVLIRMDDITGANAVVSDAGQNGNPFVNSLGQLLAFGYVNGVNGGNVCLDTVTSFSNPLAVGPGLGADPNNPTDTFFTGGSYSNNIWQGDGLQGNDTRIYIPDTLNNRLVRVDNPSGTHWTTCTGPQGHTAFSSPWAVCEYQGKLYVVDGNHPRIVRIDDMTGANPVAFPASQL